MTEEQESWNYKCHYCGKRIVGAGVIAHSVTFNDKLEGGYEDDYDKIVDYYHESCYMQMEDNSYLYLFETPRQARIRELEERAIAKYRDSVEWRYIEEMLSEEEQEELRRLYKEEDEEYGRR